MKRALVLAGAAFAAMAAGAYAHAEERREERRERHEIRIERISRVDANTDGFITRAEAQAEAERAFGELDTDDNGKLDSADRGPGVHHVMIERGGGEHRGGRHHRRGHDGDHDVDVIIRTEGGGERTVIERREVRVAPPAGAAPPAPPAAPRPPRPPMAMMLFMNTEESDLNNDGALSKEEFVAQQLRFFDAADANRDGKIKFEAPPMPPEPPEPPMPPAPPTRR